MTSRIERLLLVATPVVAITVVALGLRVGARSAVRAAVVYGAPMSDAGTGLAWQVVAFDEDHGTREPAVLPDVQVIARTGEREARWHGPTNGDGAAEMLLELPGTDRVWLEVRAGTTLLARGEASPPPSILRAPPGSAWARFARREGAVVLDVAVLGQRAASGFPATIWVRATDAATHAPLPGVSVEAERDASLTPASATSRTDARGWAQIVATPMGHAVALVLRARAADGRPGEWAGGLFVSPGASQLVTRARWAPDEEPEIEVVVPNVRSTGYVEIDDARGRAWAKAITLAPGGDAMPRAIARAPKLAPGLYWAVVSGDPSGASQLGPGTLVRPFFVAASDAAALAFGTDEAECATPQDPRETSRVLGLCLALAGASPVPRWAALEGFSMQHALDADKRVRGLSLALGAIFVAVLLETLLLLRAAVVSRERMRAAQISPEAGPRQVAGHAWRVGVAVLVALLGFALLAAFLVRAS